MELSNESGGEEKEMLTDAQYAHKWVAQAIELNGNVTGIAPKTIEKAVLQAILRIAKSLNSRPFKNNKAYDTMVDACFKMLVTDLSTLVAFGPEEFKKSMERSVRNEPDDEKAILLSIGSKTMAKALGINTSIRKTAASAESRFKIPKHSHEEHRR